METIKIQGSEDTPKIILDAGNEILEISGRSLPEDVSSFYEPVLNWLNQIIARYPDEAGGNA
jgi:hypothetical protein